MKYSVKIYSVKSDEPMAAFGVYRLGFETARSPLADSRFGFHLQWFAAEDEGRTEEPTEQKIRKAREEGKVAKSTEFTSAVVLLLPVIAIGILSGYLLYTSIDMMHSFLSKIGETEVEGNRQIVTLFLSYLVRLITPVVSVAFFAAILGNVLQFGFLFSTKPITPDLEKITPKLGKFIQKSFFSGEALFNLAKSLLKVIIIGVISFIFIRAEIETIAMYVNAPFTASFVSVAGIAFRILVASSLAMLALSLPDYLFQRKQHMESLKMTRQEVKEERKTTEGDPLVKSRLKERMRDLLNRNMIQNVPQADVVITNPTHFAVAMEWNRESMAAPMVIAKGQDNMAFRIREAAQEHGVPIVENKPLARALYGEVEIGDIIPEKYYQVMAVVLAEVYKMKERAS